MKCPNCGAKLSCSCKRRTASDGKIVCANCITNYEKSIKNLKSGNSEITIINVKAK